MRILVCGGRDYDDSFTLHSVLEELNPTFIIHGDAKGADTLAADFAHMYRINCLAVPAKWGLHGKSAGPIRNAEMLEYNPELVVAFPGGKGTANMISQAKKAGIKVLEIGCKETETL